LIFILTSSQIAPAIGPVLGGVLAQFLGWRWIFWILVICAAAFLVAFLILFPETGRNVCVIGTQAWESMTCSFLAILGCRKR
jgi:predicted MFS family arabinose efflux permease